MALDETRVGSGQEWVLGGRGENTGEVMARPSLVRSQVVPPGRAGEGPLVPLQKTASAGGGGEVGTGQTGATPMAASWVSRRYAWRAQYSVAEGERDRFCAAEILSDEDLCLSTTPVTQGRDPSRTDDGEEVEQVLSGAVASRGLS